MNDLTDITTAYKFSPELQRKLGITPEYVVSRKSEDFNVTLGNLQFQFRIDDVKLNTKQRLFEVYHKLDPFFNDKDNCNSFEGAYLTAYSAKADAARYAVHLFKEGKWATARLV